MEYVFRIPRQPIEFVTKQTIGLCVQTFKLKEKMAALFKLFTQTIIRITELEFEGLK